MPFSDFKVLTFDVVGTLIDFESGILQAMRRISGKTERELGDDAIFAAYLRGRDIHHQRSSEVMADVYLHVAKALGLPADERAAGVSGVGLSLARVFDSAQRYGARGALPRRHDQCGPRSLSFIHHSATRFTTARRRAAASRPNSSRSIAAANRHGYGKTRSCAWRRASTTTSASRGRSATRSAGSRHQEVRLWQRRRRALTKPDYFATLAALIVTWSEGNRSHCRGANADAGFALPRCGTRRRGSRLAPLRIDAGRRCKWRLHRAFGPRVIGRQRARASDARSQSTRLGRQGAMAASSREVPPVISALHITLQHAAQRWHQSRRSGRLRRDLVGDFASPARFVRTSRQGAQSSNLAPRLAGASGCARGSAIARVGAARASARRKPKVFVGGVQ